MTPPMIRTENGLNVPISGAPKQEIEDGKPIKSVAVLGGDYVGMKPTMLVQEGDTVRLGQPLFEDKKNPGVIFTAPGGGAVRAIVRGPKRRFDGLVIDLEENEGDQFQSFKKYEDDYLAGLPREEVREALVKSGLWTSLRTRPYGKTPSIDSAPHSIFVTVIDTHPLAAEPAVVLKEPDYERFFVHGVQALTTQTDGKVYLCRAPAKKLPEFDHEQIESVAFDGPHPAGLVGTHIHFLAPVSATRTVWHLNYQDVVAIGKLLLTGELTNTRVVSLCGPGVKKPELLRTRLGASLQDLTSEGLEEGELRMISGSVLSGKQCLDGLAYLGRYDNQVSVLQEGREREFLGWAGPGGDKFSISRAFLSAIGLKEPQKMTTTTHGSMRAIVPIGLYEKVMPLDIVATPLLKALLVQDNETAQQLGCLELEEEDLALCTFVCPGKNEYGPLLRQSLTNIELEG